MPSFACESCGREFSVPEATLAKFPGWQPKRCLPCKKQTEPKGKTTKTTPAKAPRPPRTNNGSREENLTVAEVLEKYTGGPQDGVFTDGSAEPNPGPGGWGAVYVVDNTIISEKWGHEPKTTNNRMELSALIAGCAMVPEGKPAVIYTDSQLCVNTITQWAKGWEARGWKRKDGPIANLDLVQELYGIFQRRPELELRWIRAHAGNRWNEYADALATAYRRSER